jgi:hypothetical protein
MTSNKIARTGRVQDWLNDPTSRLPVSCTVFVVEDGMEGQDGIEDSWHFVSHALRNGAGCAVHLSKLRPKGHDNGRGLVSSGPVSFAKIYSTLNEVLRRGGVYKNGAVVVHLDLNHPDALEFIETPRSELQWVKRCIDITPEWWASFPNKADLLAAIRRGDVWLNKVKYEKGERIYGNVCLEVYLKSRGTCLLEHVNLGMCHNLTTLEEAFQEGMDELIELHSRTGVGDTGYYLDPSADRQVGLGLVGLANFLRIQGVTYKQFGHSLEWARFRNRASVSEGGYLSDSMALALKRGIDSAACIAKAAGMERAFCIAPTASSAYRYTDLEGFTLAPEIAPPISRHVDRDSGTFGVQSFDHGPVETAAEVGWLDFKRVADQLVAMFSETGLFHGYSMNTWSDQIVYDERFISDWLAGPQTSIYYSLQVAPDTQRKDDAMAILDDDFRDLFAFDEEPEACTFDTVCTSCAE